MAWAIRIADTTNLSGDPTQVAAPQLAALTEQLGQWPVSHISIGGAMDSEAQLRVWNPTRASQIQDGWHARWAAAIRKTGKRILWRMEWGTFRGFYGAPKLTARTTPAITLDQYVTMTQQYIAAHAAWFEPGDIFAPLTEADLGGFGPMPTAQFPDNMAYNEFLQNLLTGCRATFAQIGKPGIFVGCLGITPNPGGPNGWTPATVDAFQGLVSYDLYIHHPPAFQDRLEWLHAQYPIDTVLTEFGDVFDPGKPEAVRVAYTNEYFRVLARLPWIVGAGCWPTCNLPSGGAEQANLLHFPSLLPTALTPAVTTWYARMTPRPWIRTLAFGAGGGAAVGLLTRRPLGIGVGTAGGLAAGAGWMIATRPRPMRPKPSPTQITQALWTLTDRPAFVIRGANLGTHAPLAGTLDSLIVEDLTRSWNAGNTRQGDGVALAVAQWTPARIVGQLGAGYGGSWVLHPGDQVRIQVRNPQTGQWAVWTGSV